MLHPGGFPRTAEHPVPGYPQQVLLRDGRPAEYINLDNAASTPALGPVWHKVMSFMNWYSSVHRGSGFLSQVATRAFEDARKAVGSFVGASEERDVVIFVKNTTEAINKLSYRLALQPEDTILITEMEHHSNDLPWRGKARVVRCRVDSRGSLDLDDLARQIRCHAGKLRLVAVTGASNVTGYVNNIHTIARMAHVYGVPVLVDAAQLAPHRPIRMLPHEDQGHIDFIAFSGHKMYAPFGAGVLIGPKAFFLEGAPELVGGGTVRTVTRDTVTWALPPERDEAGSPNVVGAVAMGASALYLSGYGMHRVSQHEQALLARLLNRISRIPSVRIYGDPTATPHRLGVVSLNIDGIHHRALARALSGEGAIGVRNGCFCAQPYIHRLLNLGDAEVAHYSRNMSADALLPGMVRLSLGLYNTEEEIDAAAEMIERIAGNPAFYAARYSAPATPDSQPCTDPRRFFSLFA